MRTNTQGEVVGVCTHVTTDASNVTSYRCDEFVANMTSVCTEALHDAMAATFKRLVNFQGPRKQVSELASAEEAVALQIAFVGAIRTAAALAPCVGDKAESLRALLGVVLAHAPVQATVLKLVVVQQGRSIMTIATELATWAAGQMLGALHTVGGFDGADSALHRRRDLLRTAVTSPLPLPLIRGVGLSVLFQAFTLDYASVMGGKPETAAAQFIDVLPLSVREAVQREDARAVMTGGRKIRSLLSADQHSGQTLMWLGAHLPPPTVPKPPVGGIVPRVDRRQDRQRTPTGQRAPPQLRSQRAPLSAAAQAQRDQDTATGACYTCHQEGHKSNDCNERPCHRCSGRHNRTVPCPPDESGN